MGLVDIDARDQDARTAYALDWLVDAAPELSSRTFLSRGQRVTGIVVIAAIIVGFVLKPIATGIALVGIITLLYLVSVIYRIMITNRSLREPNVIDVTDDEARAVADEDLPVYTVLVPMYKEGGVVPNLVANLRALEYPTAKLDVKLLVEAGDLETIAAATTHADSWMEIVVVPESTPRTKPKALNYGLTLATGEYITIYDAEDRPDVLQLRRAVVAFGRLPDDIGCLQAQLAYWNTDQNLLTRWFTIEYLQWFQLLLPGLAASDAPVPLGGTSNHIKRALIDEIGAWDPYNVTEDADLGIRLHRGGYRSAVLASVTFEEANSDYVNWNNQRSRWYKGYIQTWLVHMRHPAHLVDELGWKGFAQFNAFVGGTPALALLNLVFWAMTLAWFVGHFTFIKQLYPTAIYYPALFCFVFGNVIVWYQFLLAARLSRKPSLVWAALGVPIYWLMMSIAAVKACWQVMGDRSFWEKTVHGLNETDAAEIDLVVDRDVEEVVRIAVPAFVAPPAPVLATRVDESSHDRIAWTGGISHALQLAGYALMGFVVYVIALSGFGPAFASSHDAAGPLARVPAGGAAIARLTIPSVGINTTISEGTGPRALRHGVGHVRGSALPGERGETIVIGHRYAAGGQFHALGRVHVDDMLTVSTADGSAQYKVTVVGSRQRSAITPSASGSRLMLVTGTSGWNPSRLLVVESKQVGKSTIQFEGAAPPYSGIPRIPGFDGGKAVIALVLALCAIFVLRSRRRIPPRVDRRWATLIVVACSAAVLYATFVAATQALPPSF